MRSATTKWSVLSLICLLLSTVVIAQDIAAVNHKAPQTTSQQDAPVFKYTGYWYVKSGDELILVKEGNLPPGLVRKSSQYQVESIDIESVKQTLQFSHQNEYQGRFVEKNVFVIADESGTGGVGSVTPNGNRGSDARIFPSVMNNSKRDIAEFMIPYGDPNNPRGQTVSTQSGFAAEECFFTNPAYMSLRQNYNAYSNKCGMGAPYCTVGFSVSGNLFYIFCQQTN